MRNDPRRAGRSIRVMQSFGPPRPTTNPYIHMLDEALAATPGLEHLRFSRRRALLGRYDALQLHWPETLLGGSTPVRARARRLFARLLCARLALTPVALVRTMHNAQPHERRSAADQRILDWLERRTDHRIALNPQTVAPHAAGSTVILHGHYRDWFASVPKREPRAATLAAVGLVRPYKGLEDLVEALASTAEAAPWLRLRIAGRATDSSLAAALRASAEGDRRIELDLRHLSEAEFATTVMESIGVVLPYRLMHNSGAALAALSLDRPVLVPSNEVTEALADEVGRSWVRTFRGRLDGAALLEFAEAAALAPASAPDLRARDWHGVGEAHRDACRAAIERRRSIWSRS